MQASTVNFLEQTCTTQILPIRPSHWLLLRPPGLLLPRLASPQNPPPPTLHPPLHLPQLPTQPLSRPQLPLNLPPTTPLITRILLTEKVTTMSQGSKLQMQLCRKRK